MLRKNMKHKRLTFAMILSMSLALISCSDEQQNVNKLATDGATTDVVREVQSPAGIMEYIPADTPVLFVYAIDPNNPVPENLKKKVEKVYSSVGEIIKASMQENFKKYAKKAPKAEEMTALMDKWLSADGFKKLGLSFAENELAVYAVDLFPVVRMTLANTHSMNEVLDELLAKANESTADSASKKQYHGHTVYLFGDKELQVMIALEGNNIVASISAPREVDELMPKLLGFEKPAQNIAQSAQFQDTINKYNYLSNSLYWINIRELADYFVNPAMHPTAMLDILKIQDNMLSPDCKTEILDILDKMPRMVGGYKTLGEHSMESHAVLELEQGLGSLLATMTGRIPSVENENVLSYGLSFDLAKAKEVALKFVTSIEQQPYKCKMMQSMNTQATTLKARLSQPLPMFVGNFKGANVIIDNLELDLTSQIPAEMIKDLKARVLLAVDNPQALQGMAEMALPEFQKLGLKMGGDAVNVTSLIPVTGTQIPINLDHVFLALGEETIGFSIGEGTEIALKQSVSAESMQELLNFNISAEIYRDLFSSLDKIDKGSASANQGQFIMRQLMNDFIWWDSESASMNFTDQGFEIWANVRY
jgi:hypothetical protein